MPRPSSTGPISPKPPETPVFFVDRSLGYYDVPGALREAGYHVEIHDDHFGQTTVDPEWIQAAAEHGWVILTKDLGRKSLGLFIAATRESGATVFMIISKGMRGRDTGQLVVDVMPKILQHLDAHRSPFIAKVYRDKSVKLWRAWPESAPSD